MPPPGERHRLNREQVVVAALALLQQVGIENLSLRKLASTLGVTTPTLYWHFSSKQDLIDAMAASAMGSMRVPEDAGSGSVHWAEWLSWMGRESRRAMLAHRDGALLISLSRPTSRQWGDVERAIGLLCHAGFTPRQAMIAIGTTMDYVVGGVLEEQQRSDTEHGPAGMNPYTAPMVAKAVQGGIDADERFEAGLHIIVNGLRALLT